MMVAKGVRFIKLDFILVGDGEVVESKKRLGY